MMKLYFQAEFDYSMLFLIWKYLNNEVQASRSAGLLKAAEKADTRRRNLGLFWDDFEQPQLFFFFEVRCSDCSPPAWFSFLYINSIFLYSSF